MATSRDDPGAMRAQALATTLADSGCPAIAQEIGHSSITFDPDQFTTALKDDEPTNRAFSEFLHLLESKWAAKNAELLTTIATADNDTITLRAQITVLHNELAAAHDRLATERANGRTQDNTHGRDGVKVKDPEVFTGEEKDTTKRQTEYTSWRTKINFRHHLDTAQFNTEYKKIIHIGSLLGGNALLAHKTALDTIMANGDDPMNWAWPSAQEFFVALDQQYDNLDLVALAQREIAELVQGGTPFPDFLTEFTVLADRCGYNNAQRVQTIRTKLNGKLKHALVSVYPTPGVDDWNGWVKVLRGIAENLANLDHQKRLANVNRNDFSRNRPAADPQGSDPMDLDRVHINKISREEMTYRIANNLCKRCGGSGHYAIQCDGKGSGGRGRGYGVNRGQQRGGIGRGPRGGDRGAPGFPNQPPHWNAPRYAGPTNPSSPAPTRPPPAFYWNTPPTGPNIRTANYTPGFVVADSDAASLAGSTDMGVSTSITSYSPPPRHAPNELESSYTTGEGQPKE